MMNMFSLIAEQVCDRQELFEKEARIMQTLLNDGYHIQEADAALTLMQSIVKRQTETFFGTEENRRHAAIRTMNSEERRRFTTEAFAFALKLAHLGVLTEDEREELLERSMNQQRERIELDHVKNQVAFMLFTSAQERGDDAQSGQRWMKNTDWQ